MPRRVIDEGIAGEDGSGGDEIVDLAGQPVDDSDAARRARKIELCLVLIGRAVVVKDIVVGGQGFRREHVDASPARAKIAVFQRDRAFIAFDLQCSIVASDECGVINRNVLIVGIEPKTLGLIVV